MRLRQIDYILSNTPRHKETGLILSEGLYVRWSYMTLNYQIWRKCTQMKFVQNFQALTLEHMC